jgi:hypothetical protein
VGGIARRRSPANRVGVGSAAGVVVAAGPEAAGELGLGELQPATAARRPTATRILRTTSSPMSL